ncbi:UV excision repair protein RAD23 B [Histomonas meleagridis]|uniref:UV excision repair protein RAD23-like B n=1 Tax=Histomonas meleagridis TaxID=135588 RepID=UPI003559DD57|nr:UV excision repair protein RAD23 B [Histomonas meleagridis]KAH0798148.1 UV excision repair protein RAD23-like B [Histomonas meleagridis]
MIICFRSLSGKQVVLDIDPSKTVKDIIPKIISRFKLDGHTVSLIYAGKILQDNQLINDINYKPDDFIIVKATRQNPQNSNQTPSNPSQQSSNQTTQNPQNPNQTPQNPNQQSANQTTQEHPSNQAAQVPNTNQAQSANPNQAPQPQDAQNQQPQSNSGQNEQAPTANQSVTPPFPVPHPELYAQNFNTLIDVGFSPSLVERALVASQNNLELAADMLASGNVPPLPDPPRSSPARPQQRQQQQRQRRRRSLEAPYPRPPELFASRNDSYEEHPSSRALREFIMENPPQSIAFILRCINNIDHALFESMENNIIPFLTMVGVYSEQRGNNVSIPTHINTGQSAIETILSRRYDREQRNAITRLIALGFDPVDVVDAYEANNFDEEATLDALNNV